jgi:drug/metabolite transporter (DMT)-like permease
MDRTDLKGYLFAALTALSWATSPILIRKGLEELPSPMWGTAIGLLAATTCYLGWFASRYGWPRSPASKRTALRFQVTAGITSSLGVVARNVALSMATVAAVMSLLQTSALFTLFLAPLILGRQLERISTRLIAGVVLLVAGSSLIILGRNI